MMWHRINFKNGMTYSGISLHTQFDDDGEISVSNVGITD